MATRLFDLNIEEVLEAWEVSHAIREVISNALDEHQLSGTKDISIESVGPDHWSIRDFGRGLQIEHFTLNENQEKLAADSGVIGKFGVGLKDALATFHRRGVDVIIRSRHGSFSLQETEKHSFSGIKTLHVAYDSTPNDMDGTEFELSGVTTEQMDEAKSLFLAFNDEKVLDATRYGEVLRRRKDGGRVYISGVFASEEPNFLFSYNVTNLTDAMKKRLNRERMNVGRTTYADRIKQILKEAEADEVIEELIDEILGRGRKQVRDEMQWIEISQLSLTRLYERDKVIFVTEDELHSHPDVIDHARRDRLKVVIVTRPEKKKLQEQAEGGGVAVRLLEDYVAEFNESFEYSFVEPDDLSAEERAVFDRTDEILSLVGEGAEHEEGALDVRLSETLRLTRDDTEGVWDPEIQAIVIKRDRLASLTDYASTLLHEAAHATTGTHDATREFENVLTGYLGDTASTALDR